MKIHIITTGGTIDKVYFDAKSEFQVGETYIGDVLRRANVSVAFEIEELMRKDSLEMTDEDRALIAQRVRDAEADKIVITHGTDTLADTAEALGAVKGKTVVMTGSMQPARFQDSDADFNLGCAFAAVQSLPEGVYIAVNGLIFRAGEARKNVEANRFESKS